MSLAIATQTSPSAWWDEDEATILTAIEILNERSRR